MTYSIRVIEVVQGRNLVTPRYYIDGPLRSYRAASRADAEYLASILNGITNKQHSAALEAATEEEYAETA